MSDISLACSCGQTQTIDCSYAGTGITDNDIIHAWWWLHADCPEHVRHAPPRNFDATMLVVAIRGPLEAEAERNKEDRDE